MFTHFISQVACVAMLYAIMLVATFPFLVFFGKPKPWQKVVQFLMSFPIDNMKFGFTSFGAAVVAAFLNGLLWSFTVVGSVWLIGLLIQSIKSLP